VIILKTSCHWCGKRIDTTSFNKNTCSDECHWYFKRHMQFREKNRKKFSVLCFSVLFLALISIITYHIKWALLIILFGLGITFIFIPFTLQKSISIIGAKRNILFTRIIGAIMFILGILTLCFGWLNQVVIQKNQTKLMNYNFYFISETKMDEILNKQRYSFSQSIDQKYISVITLDKYKGSVKEYNIDKEGSTNITIPKDKDFIISFPCYSCSIYIWNMKNNINSEIIKFTKSSRIDLPTPFSERGKCGNGYDRQNFYFSSLKEGTEKLKLRYEHPENPDQEYYETTLNISVK